MSKDLQNIAVSKCLENEFSLTPNRLVILDELENYKRPVSAYLLKEKLYKKGKKLNIASIYRVIDFWMNLGVVHKISAINKFILCSDPDEKHTHITNFCRKCEKSFETCSKRMGLDLSKGTEALGLKFTNDTHIEVSVLCRSCN